MKHLLPLVSIFLFGTLTHAQWYFESAVISSHQGSHELENMRGGTARTTKLNAYKGYVYILRCANNCFYTGSTIDLERRLRQHQQGEGANYTKKHLPVLLVYQQEFPTIQEAFRREKQIQGWSHAKKQALIDGDFDTLRALSFGN